jgi:glycerol-3-phosphate dehydrogenase
VSRARTAPSGPSTYLNAARRTADLQALADGDPVDVLVIGGGVTGAGAALDAATRGLSVALLERRDLATGTSRWSSKLAHGGLRYLSKGQFGVAWESARERHRLATVVAPHLIRALPQLTPVFGRVPPPVALALETGIRMGDGMRALAGTSRRRLPPMRRIAADEAKLWGPEIKPEHLRGAILHWDGQLEDDARLVVAIARTAAAHGVRVVTYAEVELITATGVQAHDVLSDSRFDVKASHVINATGVWADRLVDGISLRPSRGSHLLIDAARLGNPRASINIPVPGHFGRFVFAVPRSDGLVMIGLTDDPHEGAIPDAPRPTPEDESFLLETASLAFARPLTEADVLGSYAGLRPLLDSGDGATSDISRAHAVIEDKTTGAVTVVGGKLTTYRQMAQDAVDAIAARPGVRAGRCRTHKLPLVGARPYKAPKPQGIPARLLNRFGDEAAEIVALAADDPALLEPVAPGLPALGVEFVAAIEREGALNVDDVLDIRTRLGLVPAWREQALPAAQRALEVAVQPAGAIASSRPTISSA